MVAEVLASNGYQLSRLDQGSYASKQFDALFPSRQGFAMLFDIHWRFSNRVIFNHILQFEEY